MSRKSTFNASETNKLVEICGKYSGIIECKKTDCIRSKQKDDAWEKIAQEFNGINEIYRESRELKKKYGNIKYATKSKAAKERRGVYGTGGGPAASVSLTGVEERMMSILNEKEMEGVPNTADSDVMEDTNAADPDISFETPVSGPSTLRRKISTPLFTPRKAERSTKGTSWEVLASVKSKWTEAKMQAEISLAKKEEERVELQMKLIRERQEVDVLQCREHHALEMEILSIRLEREKLELKKLYSAKP